MRPLALLATMLAACLTPEGDSASSIGTLRTVHVPPPGEDHPPRCGASGEPCCDGKGDPGLEWVIGFVCDRSGTSPTCSPCGIGAGSLCCRGHLGEAECAGAALACDYKAGGVCSTCGGYDEPCCSGATCNAGLLCWNGTTGDRCGTSAGHPDDA